MLTNEEEEFVQITLPDGSDPNEHLLSKTYIEDIRKDKEISQNQIRVSNGSYDDIESDDVEIEFTCGGEKREEENNQSLLNVVTVLRPNFSGRKICIIGTYNSQVIFTSYFFELFEISSYDVTK